MANTKTYTVSPGDQVGFAVNIELGHPVPTSYVAPGPGTWPRNCEDGTPNLVGQTAVYTNKVFAFLAIHREQATSILHFLHDLRGVALKCHNWFDDQLTNVTSGVS
ncbi:hypothetical protein BDV38DRAFT_288901 [Aspergillus pseudotamarii]|uniref:Uncharacterized protein n=1 Tax=Aspergillus pseudotamarii TaxID=132259 RepID=A0A5N6S9A9_ASPPS|nr:uncharacterized protein BDV38DRAFT_288901 [Aspergillus pseudotamarii]KAE8131232.1 hypothetical protein BDV38DRAFT_288901 [Aspergillus pseudotamarii]